jgi:hypothetical protein
MVDAHRALCYHGALMVAQDLHLTNYYTGKRDNAVAWSFGPSDAK